MLQDRPTAKVRTRINAPVILEAYTHSLTHSGHAILSSQAIAHIIDQTQTDLKKELKKELHKKILETVAPKQIPAPVPMFVVQSPDGGQAIMLLSNYIVTPRRLGLRIVQLHSHYGSNVCVGG